MDASGAAQRIRDAGGGELVVSALRAHTADAGVARTCCMALYNMLEHGLASSIDVGAAASLAAAALRTHRSDETVQINASRLADLLLKSQPAPLEAGASPEHAALARVAELKGRRDFASLVRDMDTFPECEELQYKGCVAVFDLFDNSGSGEEAAAAGAIECFARSLDVFPYSAKTQRTSLYALTRLTCLAANKRRAGNAGAIRLAVHALRFFPNDTNLNCNALIALGNVSIEDQFRAEPLNLGALALVVAALRRCFHQFILFVFPSRHTLILCRHV